MSSTKQAVRALLLLSIASVYVCWVAGCGSITSVRPIGQGKQSLSFAIGGPFADYFGGPKPIPYGLVRYRRGLSETTDLFASYHLTPAVMGIFGIDAGLAKQLAAQRGFRPALTAGGSANFFMLAYDTAHAFKPDFSSIRAYPQLYMIGSYMLKQHLVYFGADNVFQFTNPYLISVLVLGGEYRWTRLFRTTIETRWYAPWENSQFRTVNYTAPIQKHGDVGIILGLNFYL